MRFLVVALPLCLIAAPLFSHGASERRFVALQQAAPQPEPAKAGLKALDFSPFGYYQTACSRCHGENGANYGDMLKNKSDAQLHDGIHAMAVGPGQSPLDEEQIQVMVLWHRALVEGKAFVHLSKIERGDKIILSGEATPDAKVILKSVDKSFEATRQGPNWTLEAPQDLNLEAAELSAQM